MNDIIKLINEIPKLHKKEGCKKEEILQAQKELDITFSNNFIEYLKEFGAISFYGTEWNGLHTAEYRDVVKATLENRELNNNFPKNVYIIEDLHIDDIKVVSDCNDCIYEWNGKKLIKIYDSLINYLKECIARKQ